MKRFDQINMIPFIDVMLVLLAIVLTTASFVSQGLIDVELPQTQQAVQPMESQPPPIEITLDAEQQLFFQSQLINWSQLPKKLDALPQNQAILLRIDKSVPFEQFIKLIDPLKKGQFKNLSIHAESG